MDIDEIYPSRWLKAADLSPDGDQVTIRKVTMEEIGEERERKAIMSFDELDKELVVNKTNLNSIAELTSERNSDNWTGHVIKLVRVRVPFGGKNVEAIRVEAGDAKPQRRLRAKAKLAEPAFDL
jgi:hypothetical protein